MAIYRIEIDLSKFHVDDEGDAVAGVLRLAARDLESSVIPDKTDLVDKNGDFVGLAYRLGK